MIKMRTQNKTSHNPYILDHDIRFMTISKYLEDAKIRDPFMTAPCGWFDWYMVKNINLVFSYIYNDHPWYGASDTRIVEISLQELPIETAL